MVSWFLFTLYRIAGLFCEDIVSFSKWQNEKLTNKLWTKISHPAADRTNNKTEQNTNFPLERKFAPTKQTGYTVVKQFSSL